MKIQHKLVVIPLTVMLLVSTITFVIVERYLESQLIKRNIAELTVLANASLESVRTLETIGTPSDIAHSFQRLAENFSHAGNFRTTYIDANGRVLGDSDISFEQLKHIENHATKEEIKLALDKGQGITERYSSTLGRSMLYVAVRTSEAHFTDSNSHLAHPIIARIARPTASINVAINKLRGTLFLTGVLSLFAVLTLSLFGAKTLNKSVEHSKQLLEQRVIDRTTEISILQSFSGLLNACSTFDEAGEVMNNVIPKLLPGFKGSISIIKSSRNRLDHITSWGGDWTGADRFSPKECWSLRKGHPHISTEFGIQTICQHWEEKPSEQTLCIPLLAQGETIGVLHFVVPFDTDLHEKQDLYNAIAEQTGLTLANIQLQDDLHEQAIRDPLTGLFNRRYMLEALDQAQSRAERNSSEISIIMMDLDHFKLFNDNFGHDAGDHVLKAVSKVLKDSLRQEDIPCRYGGEEFCIVCPETTKEQVIPIAERINKGIRALDLNINQLSLGTVTTSIGIAVYPKQAASVDDTIKVADEALYLAKKNGRDRIEVFQSGDKKTEAKVEIPTSNIKSI